MAPRSHEHGGYALPAQYLVIDPVNEIAAEAGTGPGRRAVWIQARPEITSIALPRLFQGTHMY
jgi:hypothetical protein